MQMTRPEGMLLHTFGRCAFQRYREKEMGFWGCVEYLAASGIASFILGRILPKRWFHHNKFPYMQYSFEHGGKIYEKLRIRLWHRKLPDMSRIFPRLMPPKSFGFNEVHRLPEMIQETCVAELIHGLLCFVGLHCISIWQGFGGILVAVLNILGNLLFILVQRYNRPRLLRLMNNAGRRKSLCEC